MDGLNWIECVLKFLLEHSLTQPSAPRSVRKPEKTNETEPFDLVIILHAYFHPSTSLPHRNTINIGTGLIEKDEIEATTEEMPNI